MCTSMLNESQQKPKERKEDSTQGEYAYFRLPGSAGGGVAPRRNNRITESATKEGSESESEEGDTRIKRKTTRRKDKKRTKKEQGMRHGERQKGEGKKKRKRRENGKDVRAVLC